MLLSTFKLQRAAFLALASAAIGFAGVNAIAQDKPGLRTQNQTQDQVGLKDPIYGSQLMTVAERNEFRRHMRSLKSNQEREAYRLEHHKLMQERAREKGVSLPEVPPARGKGKQAGPGGGRMGGGVGNGMGTGPSGNN